MGKSRWLGAGLLAIALVASSVAVADRGPAANVAKCKRALVNGRHVCLKLGQKCQKTYQDDYVAAGFSCRGNRLRKASIKELRGAEPVLTSANGQISLRTAMAVFDTAIADLPGFKARTGEIGDVGDATGAIGVIQANFGKLSAKQQAVVTRMTTPAADALEIPAEDPPAARRAGTPEEEILADEYISAIRRVMRSHGFALLRPIKVTFLDREQVVNGGKVAGYVPYDDLPPGTSPTCNIFITKSGRAWDAVDKPFLFAHELAHCAQRALWTSRSEAEQVPQWVVEGSAEWMGAAAIKETVYPLRSKKIVWVPWMEGPEIGLFRRAYSAVGFYAMIAQAQVDAWERIRSILLAAPSGSQPAYTAAIAGLPDIFHARWGPGLIGKPEIGPEWDYDGPAIPAGDPERVIVGNGDRRAFTIEARASAAAQLAVRADVVTVQAPKDIRGLLYTKGEQRKLAKGAFCARDGGCRCRSNTDLQLPKMSASASMGFNDANRARTVIIEGRSLRDYCRKPSPGPASCSVGTTARAADSCPAPAQGIDVYMGAEDPQVVASFKIGECTAGSGGFTANASDGSWHLEVGLSGFAGFEREYQIPYGGGDPQVIFEGPGGAVYSNSTWQPGGLPNAGAMTLGANGRQMGVGVIEFRTADQSSAIGAAGIMTCVYPDD
jgi:hypothetical protein